MPASFTVRPVCQHDTDARFRRHKAALVPPFAKTVPVVQQQLPFTPTAARRAIYAERESNVGPSAGLGCGTAIHKGEEETTELHEQMDCTGSICIDEVKYRKRSNYGSTLI